MLRRGPVRPAAAATFARQERTGQDRAQQGVQHEEREKEFVKQTERTALQAGRKGYICPRAETGALLSDGILVCILRMKT